MYRQMIGLLHHAISLLDEQGREEVIRFILSQQNPDGGFMDRGGKSDWYYSLFGMLILSAWGMETGKGKEEKGKGKREEDVDSRLTDRNLQPVAFSPQLVDKSLLKLSRFVLGQSSTEIPGFIEQCCVVLLQKELKSSQISWISNIVSLGRSFSKERYSINLSYRSFVLFLTLDCVFPFRRILNVGIRKMSARTTVDANSPCSEVAAKVFMQKMMNRDGNSEQNLLKKFACETGGFKAFLQLQQADMLSTAVALFAMNYAQYDLRLLKPGCLEFIQQNFACGAFLSGDGDQTADTEYTFYGLLALGLLAE